MKYPSVPRATAVAATLALASACAGSTSSVRPTETHRYLVTFELDGASGVHNQNRALLPEPSGRVGYTMIGTGTLADEYQLVKLTMECDIVAAGESAHCWLSLGYPDDADSADVTPARSWEVTGAATCVEPLTIEVAELGAVLSTKVCPSDV